MLESKIKQEFSEVCFYGKFDFSRSIVWKKCLIFKHISINEYFFPYEVVKCLESCTGEGRGTCDTKTGICICEDGTQGEICPGII